MGRAAWRPRALAALTALSSRERWELVRAQVALVEAQVLVLTRPAGSLVVGVPASTPPAASGAPRPSSPRAASIARAVRRAATYGLFRPKCLARSVALHRLLERAGIAGSHIRIGVRKAGGCFEAHAWVELDGRVLGDTPAHTHTFARLADVRPARG